MISNSLLATEELLSQFHNQFKSDPEISDYAAKFQMQRQRISRKSHWNIWKEYWWQWKIDPEDPTDLFACSLVADILENNLRAEIIRIYLDKQFKAYRSLHPDSINVLELKTIGKRFKWAQRMLNFYEKTFKLAFPSEWQVEILFAQAMGNWIKEDIVTVLSAVPLDRRVSEDIFTQALLKPIPSDRYISLRFKKYFYLHSHASLPRFSLLLFEAKEDDFFALKRQLLLQLFEIARQGAQKGSACYRQFWPVFPLFFGCPWDVCALVVHVQWNSPCSI